tara:strand:- start:140 stop:1372 length:1233 start_codon:yes stop_codon:yes gene_type:complete
MEIFDRDLLFLIVNILIFIIGIFLGCLSIWVIGKNRKNQSTVINNDSLDLIKARLIESFADISNKSLKTNSETFLKLAEQNLNNHQEKAKHELSEREKAVELLVKPIREALDASKLQIESLEKSRSEAYGGIKSQLQEMQHNQKSLRQETQNLVNALRRPEVRGQWGEITLRRLVELAGMVEHCDFTEQVHTDVDGQVIRPDMLVRMPDQRELVVDVKTPLDAYLSAAEAKDDSQRQINLKQHAKNVRNHIRMLSSKAYWNQFEESPEFVILFIPGDQFLSAALNEKPDLIEYALSHQIILATPTSFVALLKAVAYGWRQLALADNAKEIRILAEDLYGRLTSYVSHMNKMGRQLASSVESYNKAVGSLERSVLPGARKFIDMGVHQRKKMEKTEIIESVPRNMIEGSDT